MSQTQPDVSEYINDIFGNDSDNEEGDEKNRSISKPDENASDDDDADVGPSIRRAAAPEKPAIDTSKMKDIFGDDSDDESKKSFSDNSDNPRPTSQLKGRLQRGSKGTTDEVIDSDAEDEPTRRKRSTAKKRVRAGTKESAESAKERVRNRIKRGRAEKSKSISAAANRRTGEEEEDSGDAYDSGEDVQVTKEDVDFIDNENDEQADLVAEYERDNPQNFNEDEIDEKFTKKHKKKKSKPTFDPTERRVSKADQDPLSQVLLEMKKPKPQVLDDASKDRIVGHLQEQMNKAVERDAALVQRKEPAVHKLGLLETVERIVSMKQLQNTLLDPDSARGSILCSLRDWIEPRDANTLPALSIRTSIYNMLLHQLHPTPEQLKKTAGRGLGKNTAPIGSTIVRLRKHRMETPENKKMLKEIMEKWSRPIFSKQVDERVGKGFNAAAEGDRELQEEIKLAIAQKYRTIAEDAESAAKEKRKSAEARLAVGAVLSGAVGAAEESVDPHKEFNRVRTPFSHGFLFNVQPQLKVLDKSNQMEKLLGEGRMKLFDRMVGGKTSEKGLGKKQNPRAMDMKI